MRRLVAIVAAGLLVFATGGAAPDPQAPPTPSVRFEAVHVFFDSGDEKLAAYQLDMTTAAGNVRIVGIEGGEHRVFAEPPYYDPVAIQGDRVVIADFSTADADTLPQGRTRIATIHVQVTGDVEPEYDAKLTVAATVEGRPITGRLTLETGPRP